jgi:hypothetical protein
MAPRDLVARELRCEAGVEYTRRIGTNLKSGLDASLRTRVVGPASFKGLYHAFDSLYMKGRVLSSHAK